MDITSNDMVPINFRLFACEAVEERNRDFLDQTGM